MYIVKFLNFISLYLAVMIDLSTCDNDYENYLFIGNDKVTILSDIPAVTNHELNQFEIKKTGIFSKIKDVVIGWLSKSKTDKAISPEIKLKQGTYSCGSGKCNRIPEDERIDYEKIKKDAEKVTQPGENDLTINEERRDQFIDPPEILKNINPENMIDILKKGYEEKQKQKLMND